MMMQEKADDFGRDGLGAVKLTALMTDAELKRVQSSLLTGEHVLAEPFIKEVQFRIGEVKALNSRTRGKYALTLPGECARALYFDLRVVPELGGTADERKLRQMSAAEAQMEAHAAKEALKIAEWYRKQEAAGETVHWEDITEKIAASANPRLTERALGAIGPKAPKVIAERAEFPSLKGDALPRDFPSKHIFSYYIKPTGGVDEVNENCSAVVESVIDDHGISLPTRGRLTFKVPRNEDRKLLTLVQLAGAQIEINLSGSLGISRSLHDFILVSLHSSRTHDELVAMATDAVSGVRSRARGRSDAEGKKRFPGGLK